MSSTEQLKKALAYFRTGFLDEAEEVCNSLIAADTRDPGALRLLGQIAYQKGDLLKASNFLEASLQEKDDQFSIWIKLGNIYADLNRNSDAQQAYARATELKPDQPLGHFWQAQGFAAAGDMERAFQAYERALKLSPDFGPAYRLIVKTGNPWTKSKMFREELELKVINPSVSADDKIHMHFALAQLFNELNKPELMMGHLRMAKGLQKNRAPLWRPALQKLQKTMREVFSKVPPALSQVPHFKSVPVFVVGVPRSGSTLLESMLARHPAIGAGSETHIMPRILKKMQEDHTGQDFPDGLAQLQEESWTTLAKDLAESYAACGAGKPFVTDKLLANGQILGLLHRLAPSAKVLYVRRNPADAALSIFQNHFWEQTWPQLCALDDIGHYCGHYERAMEFWRQQLPNTIHDVWYERLVQDPEHELRSALSHLGLPFDPACLNFQEGQRAIQTLSQSQVTKPLYQTSVGKAATYAKDLGLFHEAYGDALRTQ